MSIIQAELYEALIEADASKEKAHEAAAAVATITTNYPKPEELATKEYIEKRIAQLEARIAELRSELKIEMANLEGRMDSKMAELKDELKAEMAELRAAMAELKAHQSRNSMISTSIIVTTIIAATGVLAVVN